MTSLFDPITVGAIDAPKRIMMAPLTRGRATRSHVPTPLMAEYYSQRASAGLIISRATGITQQGLGWPNAPGLCSGEQANGWKPSTHATCYLRRGAVFSTISDFEAKLEGTVFRDFWIRRLFSFTQPRGLTY
jgi:hypothetical protein